MQALWFPFKANNAKFYMSLFNAGFYLKVSWAERKGEEEVVVALVKNRGKIGEKIDIADHTKPL